MPLYSYNCRNVEHFLDTEEGQRYSDMIQRKIKTMVEKRELEEKIENTEKQLGSLAFEIIV